MHGEQEVELRKWEKIKSSSTQHMERSLIVKTHLTLTILIRQ